MYHFILGSRNIEKSQVLEIRFFVQRIIGRVKTLKMATLYSCNKIQL